MEKREEMDLPKLIQFQNKSEYSLNNSSGQYSMGRSFGNDYVCDSMGVSRYHCLLRRDKDKWFVEDKSSNGTILNTTLLRKNQSVELTNGDIIKLGVDGLDFIFVCSEDDNRTEVKENNVIILDETRDDTLPQPIVISEDDIQEEVVNLLTAASAEIGEPLETIELSSQPEKVDVDKPVTLADERNETKDPDKNLGIMENELTCSICSELFIKAVTLSCAHTFCKFCIDQWKRNKMTCPICRNNIKSTAPTLVLDNFIDKFLETQSQEMRDSRKELIKQRAESLSNVAGSSTAASSPGSAASGSTLQSSTTGVSTSASVTVDSVIEILSGDDEDYDSDNNSYNTDYYDRSDLDDFDEYDEDYNGLPGHYYGGYGTCYSCGQTGHWSNGCPLKRRRV